jgi:hypothetical protein
MTDQELNIFIGERVMGWTERFRDEESADFPFTSDPNVCRLAEDKLYELGLYGEYLKKRLSVIDARVSVVDDPSDISIALDRQTPRQRCEAMVKVMEGRDEQKSI